MQNIGIVIDTNWDNYILINNKFKKINPEHYRIHTLYGKTLEIINNCCVSNSLTLIRHAASKDYNLCKIIYNLLKICDLWLIFTNYVEYNTQTRLVIDKCDELGIKYIIVSEHSRTNDYYSFQNDQNLSFKKILMNITKLEIDNILEFDNEIYNNNFSILNHIPINISHEIKSKFKDTSGIKLKLKEIYTSIYEHKNDLNIKLLYDKEEIKREKQLKKNIKEVTQIDFNKNRMNYYKNKNN